VARIKEIEVCQQLRRNMSDLAEWDSFYVIVGSAAGGLIGLQFVVLTLLAQRPPPRAGEAGAAFASPTIVHFSTVLLLSALVRAPWHTVAPMAAVWGVIGSLGMIYLSVVARRMRRQTTYTPGAEDWLFHVLLPSFAYLMLALAALGAQSHAHDALFAAGAAALLLLFTGIHNAWDAIVYYVFVHMSSSDD
jgi:hypothetical protein